MSLPKNFADYLGDLQVSNVIRRRIDDLLRFVGGLSPQDRPITHIFLDSYVDSDGATNYGSACFFTRDRMFEVKRFLSRGRLSVDCVIIERSIRRWEIDAEKFRPGEEASPASRLRLNVELGVEGEPLAAEMRASGINCSYLYKIFTDLVVTNLVSVTWQSRDAPNGR